MGKKEVKEVVKKRPNNIGKFWDCSPEEKKAKLDAIIAKANETRRLKKQAMAEAKIKAQELLPELIAQDILRTETDNYTPRQETIDKLKSLQDSGLSFDQIRKKYFAQVSDSGWHKLTKFVFKSQIEQPEDLGLDLISAKKKHLGMLDRRVKMIKKELKQLKKAKKEGKSPLTSANELMKMLAIAEDKFMEMEMDFAKTLHSIGAVGSKVKSASIHIHSSIPRPAAENAIDVTPKVSLNDLLK